MGHAFLCKLVGPYKTPDILLDVSRSSNATILASVIFDLCVRFAALDHSIHTVLVNASHTVPIFTHVYKMTIYLGHHVIVARQKRPADQRDIADLFHKVSQLMLHMCYLLVCHYL